jgi:PEP-CTERM motif
MKAFKLLRNAVSAAGVILAVAAVPASALPTTYLFNGTFTDGQTATGDISLNVYGYLATPTSITTTSGLFSGFTYALPGDPSAQPSSNILVLSSPNYNRYLYLDFTQPLSSGTLDTLIAGSSFECDTYGSTTNACTGNASQVRYFAAGSAAPVPEPSTILIFGAALAGMAAMGALARRKAPILA